MSQKIYVKMKDGGIFHDTTKNVTVSGNRPIETVETPKLLAAIKDGYVEKITEKDYTAAIEALDATETQERKSLPLAQQNTILESEVKALKEQVAELTKENDAYKAKEAAAKEEAKAEKKEAVKK